MQWQTVCLEWYVGLQSMCETVSVASEETVACRWCFRDVRKLSRPFDTESSSESESQRPKWGHKSWAHVLRHVAGDQLLPPRHVQAHWTIQGTETVSWDGVITWPTSVKKETLCHNSSHHHTRRLLILSVGVPRLVGGGRTTAGSERHNGSAMRRTVGLMSDVAQRSV